MANSEKAMESQKKGAWARFMHWYESYQGKRIVGVVYSVGASVVIVGALFKIMHWPGASAVLIVGMITEAFLFIIGALDKPHPEFNWSNVFPQLLEFGTDPAILKEKENQARPTLLGAGVEGNVVPTGNTTDAHTTGATAPTLSDKDMASLHTGIADLAKTATQLSDLSKVATATTQLAEKMQAAGSAAEQFASSQSGLLSVSTQLSEAYKAAESHMQGAAETTKSFAANMQTIGGQLTALNAVYELQINALKEQAELAKTQNATAAKVNGHLQNLESSLSEAQKSQATYAEASKKLADQVSNLNAIYGNMLNALA